MTSAPPRSSESCTPFIVPPYTSPKVVSTATLSSTVKAMEKDCTLCIFRLLRISCLKSYLV